MSSEQTIETIKKVLEVSPPRKFDESVDLAINLKNVDLSQPQNRIDEGTGAMPSMYPPSRSGNTH